MKWLRNQMVEDSSALAVTIFHLQVTMTFESRLM